MSDLQDDDMKLYVVTVEDTIVQQRDYVTRGRNKEDAEAKVKGGLFISESEPVTTETLTSDVKDVVHVPLNADEDENGNLLP